MLPIDPTEWATVLDRYCRQLMSTQARHDLDQLEAALTLLGAGHAV